MQTRPDSKDTTGAKLFGIAKAPRRTEKRYPEKPATLFNKTLIYSSFRRLPEAMVFKVLDDSLRKPYWPLRQRSTRSALLSGIHRNEGCIH